MARETIWTMRDAEEAAFLYHVKMLSIRGVASHFGVAYGTARAMILAGDRTDTLRSRGSGR